MMSRFCHRLLALSLLTVAAPAMNIVSAAPPTLDYLYPAGAQRGQTVDITAGGAFSNWPPQVWTDRPGVTITPQKEKGKLQASVADDATPGVYWLRVYDAEGASSLRSFVVGTLPEVLEKETNDLPDAPHVVNQSTTVNGQLRKRGDVDTFAIALQAGQTLVAAMRANTQLGSPVDPVLQFCTADGDVLLQIDDEYGFDPLLIVKAPADGTYLVRTFGFPATPNSTIGFAGAENYVYRLTITTDGYVDHALPLAVSRDKPTTVALSGWNLPKDLVEMTIAPGDDEEVVLSHPQLGNSLPLARTPHPTIVAAENATPATPQVIELPCVVSGRIASRRQAHAFAFQAAKGQKLAFQVESRTLGYPLDVLLTMSDRTGKTYLEVDDTGREARDATLSFTAPADGEYVLVVRDLHDRGGERFAYRLTCTEQQPDYAISVAAGEFVIAAGKTLEIPVTVDRQAGFKDEIAVSIEGLPAGVTAERAASAAKGDTAKTVKLKLTAAQDAKPASGLIRIVGRSGDAKSKAASFAPFDGASLQSAEWLTTTAAK